MCANFATLTFSLLDYRDIFLLLSVYIIIFKVICHAQYRHGKLTYDHV